MVLEKANNKSLALFSLFSLFCLSGLA